MDNLRNYVCEETVYSIVCSKCYTDAESWYSENGAVLEAKAQGFVVIDGKVYCVKCAGKR